MSSSTARLAVFLLLAPIIGCSTISPKIDVPVTSLIPRTQAIFYLESLSGNPQIFCKFDDTGAWFEERLHANYDELTILLSHNLLMESDLFLSGFADGGYIKACYVNGGHYETEKAKFDKMIEALIAAGAYLPRK